MGIGDWGLGIGDWVNFYKRKRMYIELLDNTKPILNHKKYFKSNLKKGKEDIPFFPM